MATFFDMRPNGLSWAVSVVFIVLSIAGMAFSVYAAVKKIRALRYNGVNFGSVLSIISVLPVVVVCVSMLITNAEGLIYDMKLTSGEQHVISLSGNEKISSYAPEDDSGEWFAAVFTDGEKEYEFAETFSENDLKIIKESGRIDIYYTVIKGRNCVIRIDADEATVNKYSDGQ